MDAVNVCFPGHIDPYDSYGLIGCQLARYLSRTGVHTNLLAMGRRELDSQDSELAALVTKPMLVALGAIFLGYPTGYKNHANPLAHLGPRICITMFESSKILPAWIAPLNEMDAVIVPSRFCADVFRECGVSAPIHVVPLGVGEVYQYQERSQGRPLTFLAFLDRGARKGGLVATKAFGRAFGEDMNYRLLLKARTPKNKDVTVDYVEPNIEIIDRDMSEQELYELYLSCDVLINPHKGEGFGLIPREFAASGGLALTTAWSGTAGEIDHWGVPLPYTLEKATWPGHKRLEGQDLGDWAAVDVDRLATQLQTVAASFDYYRSLLPGKAWWARRLYSWPTFAERVLEIWKEAADGRSNRLSAA